MTTTKKYQLTLAGLMLATAIVTVNNNDTTCRYELGQDGNYSIMQVVPPTPTATQSNLGDNGHNDIFTATAETTKTPMLLSNTSSSKIYPKCPLSARFQRYIYQESKRKGVNPDIIIAIIDTESDFDIDCMGDYGHSYGLMQIQKRYHYNRMKRLGCYNLLDCWQNVKVGIDYYSEMYKKFHKSNHSALMAYNGGEGYAQYRLNHGIYTSSYSRTVMSLSSWYKSQRIKAGNY